MKNYLMTMMLFVIVTSANTQSLKWVNNDYNSTFYPNIPFVYHDIDFNATGEAYAISPQIVDPFLPWDPSTYVFDITKLNANGDVVSSYAYGDDSAQTLTGTSFIKVDDAGNVYAASNAAGSSFLLKFDSNLNLIYKVHYAGFIPTNCGANSNNFYICGNTSAGGVVLKYDKNNGNLLQTNLYANAVIQTGRTTSTGFVTAGSVNNNTNGDELFVQKFDLQLNISWTYLYNNTSGNFTDNAQELKVVNGTYYVGGNSENSTGTFGILIKLNGTGNMLWSKQLSASSVNYSFTSLAVDAANGFSYVLVDARRILKYNSAGVRTYNKLVYQPAARPLTLYKIATNSATGVPATSLIVMGSLFTKFHKYQEYNGGPYRWCKGPQGITCFLNPADATILAQDTFYVDSSYPTGTAEYMAFENLDGKLNTKVNPPLYYVLGYGGCSRQSQQWWSHSRVVLCYNLDGLSPRNASFNNVSNAVLLYPNPASNVLYINDEIENATVTIYDVTGQHIATHSLAFGVHEIDISALRNGIYLVQISNASGNYQTKFCKQE